MNRIKPVGPSSAQGKTEELFKNIKEKMGRVPNIFKIMGQSPAVLQAYLEFSNALGEGVLDPKLREQIALTVGQENGCDYCLSAHSALAQMAGLSDGEIKDSRQSKSRDSKVEAVLRFAKKVITEKGMIEDADIELLREKSCTEEEIVEIVANVSLNIFTNYFNHIAEPVIDFPKVDLI